MLLQSQSKRAGHSRVVEPDDQLSDVSKALTSESWSSGSTALLCPAVWDTSLSLGYARLRTSNPDTNRSWPAHPSPNLNSCCPYLNQPLVQNMPHRNLIYLTHRILVVHSASHRFQTAQLPIHNHSDDLTLTPLESTFCPTSATPSTQTRRQIAAKQRYTYAVNGHPWPMNVHSDQQLFLCSYVKMQSEPLDAREQNPRQLLQAPNKTFPNAIWENPRPPDIARDFR